MLRRLAGFGAASAVVLSLGVCGAEFCGGDCDDRGQVTVDEIVRGVGVALEVVDFCKCGLADGDGDGLVTTDEIIDAVNSALRGCPSAGPCEGA